MICAWSSHGLFLARRFEPARRGLRPCGAHAQIITVLAQFVATYRTRAFLISARHAARAQPLTRASGRPGSGSAISMRSRLHLELILHLEAYGDRSQGCATYDTGHNLSMCAFRRIEGSPEMHIEPPIARTRSAERKWWPSRGLHANRSPLCRKPFANRSRLARKPIATCQQTAQQADLRRTT